MDDIYDIFGWGFRCYLVIIHVSVCLSVCLCIALQRLRARVCFEILVLFFVWLFCVISCFFAASLLCCWALSSYLVCMFVIVFVYCLFASLLLLLLLLHSLGWFLSIAFISKCRAWQCSLYIVLVLQWAPSSLWTSWSLLGPGVEVGLTLSFIDYVRLSLK